MGTFYFHGGKKTLFCSKSQKQDDDLISSNIINILYINIYYYYMYSKAVQSAHVFVCLHTIILKNSEIAGGISAVLRADSGLTSCYQHSGLRPSC